MNVVRVRLLCTLLATLVLPGMAAAAQPPEQDAQVTQSKAFLDSHPDLRLRQKGLQALKQDRADQATHWFQRAAWYGDKPSQAMLAELYWSGHGVAVDRPRAYAWMDLAAERGGQRALAKRELYWSQLSASERERARQVGHPLHARYADAVAQPRQERQMRASRVQATGSHVGYVGTMGVCMRGDHAVDQTRIINDTCSSSVEGSRYYAQAHWSPTHYWQAQDAELERSLSPRVDIGREQALPAPR
ncbi:MULTISPECIES: sel1 repeat family protein [Stenotrophomonas]|uniref:tetratricopeptide repeat protein n=3 Tax=Lysobacteraceae TaxID=32033 RepID=UPI000D53EF5C|nr:MULTISPECIES: sel1 repeat family protein [Stenotrophomonas]AWH31430.1 hypothetical protein C1930_00380 [Stenotrophomonas sp. SAU14A_NAIMI4_8]